MKKLLKLYDCRQVYEYFDICYNSYYNGQISQAKSQFNAMPKELRKQCYKYYEGFYDFPNDRQKGMLNFFFELL